MDASVGSDEVATVRHGPNADAAAAEPEPARAEEEGPPLAPRWSGRYTLVRKLAEGGMGEVYVAYDEELDRRVAMKLLRRAAKGAVEPRMHREAQALARLSHPNVVQVYDVGHHEGRLFVTMELVEGSDLRKWWKAAPRGWRSVVEVLLQAGEGLAAAHRAGLIHRDIKPDNILVGEDGRVRVADFGLARPEAYEGGEPGPTAEVGHPGSLLETPLTEQGAIVGTPAYMSPEQFRREAVDVRSDVFSLCVVLYEGVYGERPFRGKTLREIMLATLGGTFTPPARDPPVPGWLARVIARGLARAPGDRYPTIEALLAALRRPLQAGRRWQWFAGLGALVVGAGVGAMALRGPPPCAGADEGVRALWSEERRAAIRAGLVAVAPEAGAEIAERLAGRVGRYVDALGDMSRETCLSYQRGELTDNLHDRARGCVDRRRGELAALLTVLAAPDAEAAARALDAAAGLRDVAACGDGAALLAQAAAPDAATAAALPGLVARLDQARALRLAGRYAEADGLATALVAEARALGYGPLTAEALIERGLLGAELARADAADDVAEAVALAEAAGADEVRLAGLTAWLRAVARAKAAPREVLAVIDPQAEALIQRRGEAGRAAHGRVLLAAGEAYLEKAALDVAVERLTAAEALFARLGEEAAPLLGETLNDLAMIRSSQSRHAEAHALYGRARALLEPSLGPHHPNLGYVANNEARVYEKEGDLAAAQERFAAALALWEPVYGADHPNTLQAVSHLARVSLARGDDAAARAYAERALAGRERLNGGEDESLAAPLLLLARLDLRAGDPAAARRRGARALALVEKARGAASARLFEELELLTQVALAEGALDEALAHAERALALAGEAARGRGRLALARVRWARGEQEAAHVEATAALAIEGSRAEAEAWLAAHPRGR